MRAVFAGAFARSAEADLIEQRHRDGDVAISLVAQGGGAVIGHVIFSRMAAPFASAGPYFMVKPLGGLLSVIEGHVEDAPASSRFSA